MIWILVGIFAGMLLMATGFFLTGLAVGEDRTDRTRPPATPQEALARYRIPPELPRAGYLYVEPWPTVPNVIYSDWRAEIDGTEREIRQLTQRAAEVIPPRWRDG